MAAFFAKIVLQVTGPEATMECQDEQLCAILKAGIDGAINGVQALWRKKTFYIGMRVLLIDAKNAFNKIN